MKEAVSKLNKKIKEVGGNKLKAAKNKLESAKSQLEKFRKEITRLTVEINSSERDLKKAKDKAENFEADVKVRQKIIPWSFITILFSMHNFIPNLGSRS